MGTHFETNESALANRKWVLIDAEGQVVGRLASQIAAALRGKNKRTFAPHADSGDFVVVINASKIRFTGNKWEDKIYRDYSTFIGGLIEHQAGKLFQRKPEDILRRAVQGMLPKTPLGRKQLLKLKIYRDAEHVHQAQFAAQQGSTEDKASA